MSRKRIQKKVVTPCCLDFKMMERNHRNLNRICWTIFKLNLTLSPFSLTIQYRWFSRHFWLPRFFLKSLYSCESFSIFQYELLDLTKFQPNRLVFRRWACSIFINVFRRLFFGVNYEKIPLPGLAFLIHDDCVVIWYKIVFIHFD